VLNVLCFVTDFLLIFTHQKSGVCLLIFYFYQSKNKQLMPLFLIFVLEF